MTARAPSRTLYSKNTYLNLKALNYCYCLRKKNTREQRKFASAIAQSLAPSRKKTITHKRTE